MTETNKRSKIRTSGGFFWQTAIILIIDVKETFFKALTLGR